MRRAGLTLNATTNPVIANTMIAHAIVTLMILLVAGFVKASGNGDVWVA